MHRLACALLGVFSLSCGPSVPQGQYGPYMPGNEKHLLLGPGQSLVVYRVKYWRFNSGDPPAMQLEYEARDSLADVPSLRETARALWPAFAPYVEACGLQSAIITATKLERIGTVGLWKVHTRHFGLLAHRDSAQTWRLNDDGSPLPPADRSALRIIEPSGAPLALQALTSLCVTPRREHKP